MVIVMLNLALMVSGDLVQLGSSTVFRFNHPQEADKMRRRQSVSQQLQYGHEVVAKYSVV